MRIFDTSELKLLATYLSIDDKDRSVDQIMKELKYDQSLAVHLYMEEYLPATRKYLGVDWSWCHDRYVKDLMKVIHGESGSDDITHSVSRRLIPVANLLTGLSSEGFNMIKISEMYLDNDDSDISPNVLILKTLMRGLTVLRSIDSLPNHLDYYSEIDFELRSVLFKFVGDKLILTTDQYLQVVGELTFSLISILGPENSEVVDLLAKLMLVTNPSEESLTTIDTATAIKSYLDMLYVI